MNRYLLGLCLSVFPAALYALGLGDIHLQSALNEPLKADIDLIGATSDELSTLQAGLASRETFTRYGIDPSSQLQNLRFTVSRDRAGRDVLRVTSTQAMNDPFLTFLVEVSWGRGRLLREYTLLLDPPVYMPGGEAGNAPVTAPVTQTETSRSGAVQRTETPANPPAQSTPRSAPVTQNPPAAAPSSAAGSPSSYTVRRNDTLWQIASQYTSGSPREVNRMMVALYRANPDAFNRNINELRAGAILRVPAGQELEGIGSGEAVAEVRRQYSEWRQAQGITPPATDSESAHLKLVTPTERGSGSGAPATPSTDAATNERLRSLEQQLAESRRMLELKDAELARLQKQVGQAPTEAQVPESVAPETPAPAGPEAPAAETSTQPETPPAAQSPTPEQPVAATPGESGPSLLDKLIQNWYIPVGILLILAAVIFAFLRKREEPDYEELGRLADAADEPADEEDDAATTAKLRTLKKEENFLVEESGEHPQLEPRKAATIPASEFLDEPRPSIRKTADDTLSSETAINLDQGDPLAEADFHMAYGLYDQAADLVRIAIEREPNRRDLQLKLLEIYFVWGNKDAFLQAARELQKTSADAPAGEWDKIAIMGKQIAPDDPMFARAGGSGAASGGVDLDLAGGDTRMDLDVLGGADPDSIDLDFGDEPSTPSTESTAEMPDLKGTSGIDFTFDEPPKDTSATTREMAARTMETPTIETPAYGSEAPTVESPALREKGSSTIREKIDSAQFRGRGGVSPDQTAELPIDDLGLDVNALGGGEAESLDAMEETDHPHDSMEETDHPSDAATMLAGMDERSRRMMEQAEARRRAAEDDDRTLAATRIQSDDPHVSTTGTWILDEDQIATMTSPDVSDATAKVPSPQARPAPRASDLDSTAELQKVGGDDMDLDLDSLEQALASDTAKQPVRGSSAEERFSSDVFNVGDHADTDIDLDVSEARRSHDRDQAPTERLSAADMDLPELEPVTMSEVGTKLDLARAYMDMGDPEGARNILDEVLSEGTPTQKQEAQRLLDSLPG